MEQAMYQQERVHPKVVNSAPKLLANVALTVKLHPSRPPFPMLPDSWGSFSYGSDFEENLRL